MYSRRSGRRSLLIEHIGPLILLSILTGLIAGGMIGLVTGHPPKPATTASTP